MIQVRSSSPPRVAAALMFAMALWAGMAHAQKIAMTSGFSGSWFDPDHSGQGFVVQVLERAEGPVALVYFFTYDLTGNPLWLFGLDRIQGNQVDIALREPILRDFGDGGDPAPPELIDWGTLRLSFDDCGTGTAEVVRAEKIQVRSGTLRLSRLSSIAAKSCTGGRSDDVAPEAPALGFRKFLEGQGLFAVVNYEQRPGEASFAVSVKDAPDGDYTLAVNGEPLGTLTVAESLGELRLHSPSEEGEPLLTVNPIGATITLSNEDSADVLAAALPDRLEELAAGGAPPPFGSERILARTRVDADDIPFATDTRGDEVIAQGELTRRSETVTFSVELSGAEPATYDVVVDGRTRARLGVARAGAGRTYGRVNFRFPLAPGAEPLNFDPRGSRIEIRQSETFISGIDAATTVEFHMPVTGSPLARQVASTDLK